MRMQVDDVQLGVQQAREVFSDTRVWWERLLNMGPSVFLSKELGPQHNVSFESLLHHTCLVSQQCTRSDDTLVLAFMHGCAADAGLRAAPGWACAGEQLRLWLQERVDLPGDVPAAAAGHAEPCA
jgi:hypothetical protein